MEEQKPKRRLSIITISIIIVMIVLIFVAVIVGIKKIIKKNNNIVAGNTTLEGFMELVYEKDGVFTFIDSNQKVHQYGGYLGMDNFYYNVTCVSIEKDSYVKDYALITNKEKVVVNAGEYDYISQSDDGRFYMVEKDGNEGVIDYNGKVIVPVKYQYISSHLVGDENKFHIFACKNENDEYEYINENGNLITKSDDYQTISYYSTREGSAEVIEVNGILYNILTGEEICNNNDITGFADNVLIYKNRYELYDNNLKIVKTVECENALNIKSVSYDEYIVVELALNEKATEEEKNKKYTLYDSNWNIIKESDNEIVLHKLLDGKFLVIEEKDYTVTVSDIKGNVIFTAENHRLPSNYSKSMYISIAQKGTKIYDIYDAKGNKMIEKGVRSQAMQLSGNTEKDYMVITRSNNQGSYDSFILLENLEEIPIEKSVNVLEKCGDNILLSDWDKKVIKLYNGSKQVGYDIKGSYCSQIGNYTIIQSDSEYNIINLENLKTCFYFSSSDFIKLHEDIGIIELNTGFYTMDGKLLVEKN